jgi:hypothetical protein
MSNHELDLRAAWQDPIHAEYFDFRNDYGDRFLRWDYGNFNEFKLLEEFEATLSGQHFTEIACATGDLHRYLKLVHPKFIYNGFDISAPAIERARKKFPGARFDVCDPELTDVPEKAATRTVVWARDVVQHQTEPFTFVQKVVALAQEAVFFRLRTRDVGPTVLDPVLSCQWHYGSWVPYMVLNVDELVSAMTAAAPLEEIVIVKRYECLGGHHGRFLPKETYDPHTGTAETAVFARRRKSNSDQEPRVVIRTSDDSISRMPKWVSLAERVRRRVVQRGSRL